MTTWAWRDSARSYIREVITENPGIEKKELRKLISKAYPYGERAHHPYKIWLDEVKVQLGLKKKKIKGKVNEKQLKLL